TYICKKKAIMKQFACLLLPILLLAMGCSKDVRPQSDIDEELIDAYLTENQITAERHSSGIYYIIEEPGSGGSPNIGSEVQVRYKGYLLDGTVFDETQGSQTAIFFLSNVIQGWQISIPLLMKGGKGKFIIPSQLAYGRYDRPGIPGNSVLIFEVELVNFQ
ncbi:MAG TPA: FKBP-type peptidyl-prolyl cis-trans isomerase, partial [Saprospiraceae bacterium]|nr:FKBP-type peptidyl-prolyl cis-trans isomerase [Saprospiraceae bacterium]